MTDEAVFAATASSSSVVRQMLTAGVELGFHAALDLGRRLTRVLDSPALAAQLRLSPDDAAAVAAGVEASGGAGYDPLQSALADTSAFGPVRRQYLADIWHFLPHALAAYGRTRAEVLACLRGAGVDADDADVLHAELVDRPLVPAHLLLRDARRKAIVVAIRGTSSLRDIVRDAAATPEPLTGGATAHGGMAACADGLSHYKLPPTLDPRLRARPAQAQAAGEPSSEAPAAGATPADINFNGSDTSSYATSVGAAAAAATAASAASAATTPTSAPSGPTPSAIMPAMETVGVAGVVALLQRAAIAFPDHRFVFVGHSMGAGIATLLAMRMVRTVLVAAVKSAAAFRGGPFEVLHTVLTQYLVMPPRPINVYGYATPQCAGPELAALGSLCAADLDEAALLRKAGSGPAGLSQPVGAVMQQLVRSIAGDPVVAADWLMLRHQPLVTSIVAQDDIVPRLSVASLRELHLRMATVRALAAAAPVTSVPQGAVPAVGPPSAASRWCGGCGCGPRAQRVVAASSAPVPQAPTVMAQAAPATAAAAVEPADVAVPAVPTPPGCAGAGASFKPGTSVVMAPVAAAAAATAAAAAAGGSEVPRAPAAAAPAAAAAAPQEASVPRPASPAASTAHSATWDAGQRFLATRLKAMGFPSATVRYIVDACGPGWVHPEQTLVVPGRIYHITRTQDAGGSPDLPAAGAATTGGPRPAPLSHLHAHWEPAPRATARPAAEALRRAYTVRRITPLQLRYIVLSASMMADHAAARYTDSLTAFLALAALTGTAEAEAEADAAAAAASEGTLKATGTVTSAAVHATTAGAEAEANGGVGAGVGVGVSAQQGRIGSGSV
jgi:hypothetical protein